MLSTQDTGKYLTKEWNDPDRERQACLNDSRDFSAVDQAFYEVTNTGVFDGTGHEIDDFCIMNNTPVDIRTDPKEIDQRDKPEVGH